MSPMLNPNSLSDTEVNDKRDTLLVQKWSPNEWRRKRAARRHLMDVGKYERGQLVVYRTPHNPDRIGVKRIVAIPGDRVIPLPGYPGGTDPVVVPYNHLWLEGDVNNRDKSLDSNWFGPVSQNLVIGEAKAVWKSWNCFSAKQIDWRQHKWPARERDRVEEAVVAEAGLSPDDVGHMDAWSSGQNERVLNLLCNRPDMVKRNWEASFQHREEYKKLYRESCLVMQRSEDEQKKTLAGDLARTLETTFGKENLRHGHKLSSDSKKGKRERWKPQQPLSEDHVDLQEGNAEAFKDAQVHEDESAKRREAKEKPAQAALKTMQEHNRRLAEAAEREYESKNQEREILAGPNSKWSLAQLFSRSDK